MSAQLKIKEKNCRQYEWVCTDTAQASKRHGQKRKNKSTHTLSTTRKACIARCNGNEPNRQRSIAIILSLFLFLHWERHTSPIKNMIIVYTCKNEIYREKKNNVFEPQQQRHIWKRDIHCSELTVAHWAYYTKCAMTEPKTLKSQQKQ